MAHHCRASLVTIKWYVHLWANLNCFEVTTMSPRVLTYGNIYTVWYLIFAGVFLGAVASEEYH